MAEAGAQTGRQDKAAKKEGTLVTVEDTEPGLIYSGGSPLASPASSDWRIWEAQENPQVASGGKAVYSEKPGATVKFGFRGEDLSINFVAHARPSSASISIDGAEPKTFDLSAATPDGPLGSDDRPDIIRVVFASLECGSHSVIVKNTSPAAETGTRSNQLIFDAYSYVDPGKKGCTAATTHGSNNDVEVTRDPPQPAASATVSSEHGNTADTMRLAGVVVGGIAGLAVVLLLIVWLVRRQVRREQEISTEEREDPFPDQIKDRRKRLSDVVARYQRAGHVQPCSVDVATEHGPTHRDLCYAVPPSQIAGRKAWIALDDASVHTSSLKSTPTTPRQTSPSAFYHGYGGEQHFSLPYSHPSPIVPPPNYLSPTQSPLPQADAPPQRRVEFIGAYPATPPAQQSGGPVRPILLTRSDLRPRSAPDRAISSSSPAFGSLPSSTETPSSTPDGSVQHQKSLLSGQRVGRTKTGEGTGVRRPKTTSAVEHFNRGRQWIEIDRPLSSIIARPESPGTPVKPTEEPTAEGEVGAPSPSQGDTEHLRLKEVGPLLPPKPLPQPSAKVSALAQRRGFPRRPPKSPLRGIETDGEGNCPSDDFRVTWLGYTYNHADEQSMWRSGTSSSLSSPINGGGGGGDMGDTSQSDLTRRIDLDAGRRLQPNLLDVPSGAARRRLTEMDWKGGQLPQKMYTTDEEEQGQKASIDDTNGERLFEQLEDEARTLDDQRVRRMTAGSASIRTIYSRASFDNDAGTMGSESGTSQSDLVTFRSDATIMGFITPRRP